MAGFSIDPYNIKRVRTWCFAEYGNITKSQSKLGGTWNAEIDLGFIPHFAIVRQVSINQPSVANTASTLLTAYVLANFSGNFDIVGAICGLKNQVHATLAGNCWATSCPQTIIKICKPIQSVKFQTFTSAGTPTATGLSFIGELIILVDFIELYDLTPIRKFDLTNIGRFRIFDIRGSTQNNASVATYPAVLNLAINTAAPAYDIPFIPDVLVFFQISANGSLVNGSINQPTVVGAQIFNDTQYLLLNGGMFFGLSNCFTCPTVAGKQNLDGCNVDNGIFYVGNKVHFQNTQNLSYCAGNATKDDTLMNAGNPQCFTIVGAYELISSSI